jgi:hypothetical protein
MEHQPGGWNARPGSAGRGAPTAGLTPWRPHMLTVLFVVATAVPGGMAGYPVGISFVLDEALFTGQP